MDHGEANLAHENERIVFTMAMNDELDRRGGKTTAQRHSFDVIECATPQPVQHDVGELASQQHRSHDNRCSRCFISKQREGAARVFRLRKETFYRDRRVLPRSSLRRQLVASLLTRLGDLTRCRRCHTSSILRLMRVEPSEQTVNRRQSSRSLVFGQHWNEHRRVVHSLSRPLGHVSGLDRSQQVRGLEPNSAFPHSVCPDLCIPDPPPDRGGRDAEERRGLYDGRHLLLQCQHGPPPQSLMRK